MSSTTEFTIPVGRIAAMLDVLLNEDITEPDFAFVVVIVPAHTDRIGGQAAVISNLDGEMTMDLLDNAAREMQLASDAVLDQSVSETDKQQKPS